MKKRIGFRGRAAFVGRDAFFLLAVTAPLVLIQLVYAVTYAASLDFYARMAEWDSVALAFENVLMSLLLSLSGSLLYDIAERKESHESGR